MAEKPSRPITRREFARRAAIASAAASLAPVNAVAAVSSTSPFPVHPAEVGEASPAAPAQQPAGMPKLSPASQAEVDARVQAIFSQYGSRFSEEQKADIKRLCAEAQPPLERLRAYALENGDNPALYLKPLVEREKRPASTSPRATSARTGSPAAKTPAATPPPAAKTPGAAKKP